MRIFTFFIFLCIFQHLNAQKMFIWCPNELTPSPKAEKLKEVSVDVLINDSRIFTGKVKNKCSTDELKNSIFELIKKTYPSANINLIADNKSIGSNTNFFIEINITAYYATFTSPMWFAQTDLSINIKNLKSGATNIMSKDIHSEKKFFNVGGFATAKNNLNKSFIEANIELLDFINDSLYE